MDSIHCVCDSLCTYIMYFVCTLLQYIKLNIPCIYIKLLFFIHDFEIKSFILSKKVTISLKSEHKAYKFIVYHL